MTQDNQPRPSIVSRLVDRQTVVTLAGIGAGGRGPWPFVTGIPNGKGDIGGPPAQYLAVAGWAA